MNFPCPIAIHCPDNPFANLSSEGVEVWTAVGYCCDSSLRQGFSALSQGDAFLATADLMRATCPDCALPQEFCAKADCPDGSNLTEICVPSSQADADELAAAAAAAMLPFCDSKNELFDATCFCPDGVTDPHTVYSNISHEVAAAQCEVIPKTCPPSCSLGDLSVPSLCANVERTIVISTSGTSCRSCTVSVLSGALPTGMALSVSDCTVNISGTPTVAGTYTFTLGLTNGFATSTKSFTIHVVEIVNNSLPDGQVGINYNGQLLTTGGIGPYQYTVASGSLPPGLTLGPSGDITGMPTVAGIHTFTIQVEDTGL